MKNKFLTIAILLVASSCNSSAPLENSNPLVVGAFSALENGNIGFKNIQVQGEKCLETEKDKEAECSVELVKLDLGFDTNFNEKNGAVTNIVSGIVPNEFTIKKGSTVSLAGKFKLKMGTFGMGIKSWKLTNIELKKI